MHLLTVSSILLAATSLSHAQTGTYLPDAQTGTPVASDNAAKYWCGNWAGSPEPAEVPDAGLLPARDLTRRLFVEPQLQKVPFSPIVASEPKVQVPKIWGNSMSHPSKATSPRPPAAFLTRSPTGGFRIALLSYRDAVRTYSSSKSRWSDFGDALDLLMQQCVSQGTGGAYLVPRKLAPPPLSLCSFPFLF